MKRAIVIGATSGIGKDVATLLAQQGWLVAVAGRRETLLKQLVADNENIVCYKQIDINQAEAPSLLEELIAELGGMNLYFHSSGIGWQNAELDEDKELKTVTTNCLGFTRMVDAAFNWYAKHSADGQNPEHSQRIACITSIARTKGLGAAPAYSATKRFQSNYLEALMQLAKMRQSCVKITEIRPGFVATDLIANANYPMQMKSIFVARKIVSAINSNKTVITIDWKYAILVALWRLIPRCLWIRLNFIGTSRQSHSNPN